MLFNYCNFFVLHPSRDGQSLALEKSPTTPIGRGLMKTPRRGQKTSARTFLNITQLFEFSKKLSPHALEHAYFLSSNLKTNKLAVGAFTVFAIAT